VRQDSSASTTHPPKGESERTMVGVRGSPHRELPTSWTSVASSIDRSPPPRGPHSRGPHPAALRSERQLVDNSPRGSPRRGEQKPLERLTSGSRFTEARTSGRVDVTAPYRTLPHARRPRPKARFYGSHKAPFQQALTARGAVPLGQAALSGGGRQIVRLARGVPGRENWPGSQSRRIPPAELRPARAYLNRPRTLTRREWACCTSYSAGP
jgi:hypothetical protein